MSHYWMLAALALLMACAGLATPAQAAETTGTPPGYTAWCWGRGDSGELGNGQRQNATVPVRVAGNHSFVALNANQQAYSVTCAVDSAGRGWCWGDGEDGYLANGEFDTYDAPVAVKGNHTLVDISPPCALDHTGSAWCWGDGFRGYLGDGNEYVGTIKFSVPVAVAGGHKFAKLVHACALEGNGTAYCWGNERYGGLGTGTTDESSPTPLSGNHTFLFLEHKSAIDTAGRAFGWGGNFGGELGEPYFQPSSMPKHIATDLQFVAMSLPCGLDAGGQAWCWGDGETGQLGNGVLLEPDIDGLTYNSTVPVAVSGNHTFVAIHTGGNFRCALDTSGQAWCWGSGEAGTLGNGKTKDVAAPTAVAGNHTFVALSLGSKHACGLAVDALAEPLQVPELPSLPLEVPMLPVPRNLGRPPLQPPSPPAAAAPSPDALPEQFAPPPSPAPAQASSSAAPIGAIVGGVAAGVGITAVLAFFALRPGKGWLRAPLKKAANGDESGSNTDSLSTDPAKLSSKLLLDSRDVDTFLLQNDPTLSYVASSLASARAAAGVADGNSDGALHSEVRQWEVRWEEITPLHAIGRGSFGSVYLCRWNETAVACKILVSVDDSSQRGLALPPETAKRLQAEAGIMARMRHPNIVQLLGICALPPCILTEYCSRGSLYDVLRAAAADVDKAAGMTWQLRLRMALDAATGMLYLHRMKPPIIHRDLKSPNLLVDEHYRTKVCDFNLSLLLDEARQQSTSSAAANNPIWLAPEVLQGHPATAASDVYSFGLVLWEVLTWQLPWARTPPFEVWRKVVSGERPPIPARSDLPGPDTHAFSGLNAYVQLMRECWAQDPTSRPTFADIVPRLRELLG